MVEIHRSQGDENLEDEKSDSEGSTTAYSRKDSLEEVNKTIGETTEKICSDVESNLHKENLSLADEVVTSASKSFSRISTKREMSISPKMTKKAKLNLDVQLKKYVSLLADLEQMEQYVNFACSYQMKLKENLHALGVSDDEIT